MEYYNQLSQKVESLRQAVIDYNNFNESNPTTCGTLVMVSDETENTREQISVAILRGLDEMTDVPEADLAEVFGSAEEAAEARGWFQYVRENVENTLAEIERSRDFLRRYYAI